MNIAPRRSATLFASPIHMERIIQRFEYGDNIRQRLIDAGATADLLAFLAVVIPGKRLEKYRIAFVGQEIIDHLGRDLSGASFGEILQFAAILRPCLEQFEKCIKSGDKIVSRHRYDFSDTWIIEYSRIIYPIMDENGQTFAVGHYLFHDHLLEGRYF